MSELSFDEQRAQSTLRLRQLSSEIMKQRLTPALGGRFSELKSLTDSATVPIHLLRAQVLQLALDQAHHSLAL